MDNRYSESVRYIRDRIPDTGKTGIILGSGLGSLAEHISDCKYIPYEEIPHFVTSTAPGHRGRFVFGKLGGKPVICMQGRLHYYEGHAMTDIVYPIRIMRLLGVENLLLTNAAGGVNVDFQVGDIMNITDHINFMGTNPLIGRNDESFGKRFFDMGSVYDARLRELADKAAETLSVPLRKGVYLGCTGPSYETPAEIRAFRTLGADAVGMSTVPEVIAAAHCGLKVLAFSLITNMAAGVLDQPLTEEEVIEVGSRKTDVMCALISEIVRMLP